MCSSFYQQNGVGGGGGVAIDEEHFPDETFREYVSENFDRNGDGELSDAEIIVVTEIDVSNKGLWSLQGIEYFEGLINLWCYRNDLRVLDVSRNVALSILHCNSNRIMNLDLTHNTALTKLYCDFNRLITLDVSKSLLLEELYCDSNNLSELDVTNNTMLKTLSCSSNNFVTIDLSSCTALTHLSCLYNYSLKELDVSHNTALISLYCGYDTLDNLDVSNNKALEYLGCWNKQLTILDISNNVALKSLNCGDNKLTTLDISNNTALRILECYNNQLTSLDVSNNTDLWKLSCYNNKLTTLDVSSNTALTDIKCYNNRLMALDLSHNIYLEELSCNHQVVSRNFNITTNPEYPYSMNLLSLDVSHNTSRINNLSVMYGADTNIVYSQDNVAGKIYFASLPSTVTYDYNTNNPNVNTYMDVTIILTGEPTPGDPISLDITPTAQNVSIDATITSINLSAQSVAGDLAWSFRVSGDNGLGLTSSDMAITGTIPSGTAPGTYIVIITADDDRNNPVTVYTTITVDPVPEPPAGITAITITEPAGKTISFSSSGGAFTATVATVGTPYGSVSWSLEAPEELNATITPATDGNTAQISGTAPENTAYNDALYRVTALAHDNNWNILTDKITITVPSSIPSSIKNAIREAFPDISENDIYLLDYDEMIPDIWEIDNAEAQELSRMNERAVITLPDIMPENSGVYIMMLILEDAEAGDYINLRGILGNIASSEFDDMDCALFDEDGNIIDKVPESRTVYAAMRLTEGTEAKGVITTPVVHATPSLKIIVIPVRTESRDNLREVIAEEISVEPEQVKFITDNNLSTAQEPSQEIEDIAGNDSYKIIGNMTTVKNLDEAAYYVFKVELSNSLFREIEGLNVDDVRIYGFTENAADAEARSSMIFMLNGIMNTVELLTLSGKRFDKFSSREFLMVGFLDSSQPFTMYMAKVVKAVVSALTGGGSGGGCSAGTGIIEVSAVLSFIFRRKRR